MKKFFKRFIGTLCAISLIFTFNTFAYANSSNDKVKQVKEMRGQIDFKDINYAVINKKKLTYSPKYKNGKITSKGNEEVAELNKLITEVPDMEEYIVNQINNNKNFYALGYTTIYLTENADGELVPYEEEVASKDLFTNVAYAGEGSTSLKETCTSTTGIYLGGYDSTKGCNYYTSTTNIHWNLPNYIGGKSYHGSGADYILQSCPTSFTTTSDSMYPSYRITTDYGNTWQDANPGTPGVDYWRSDGGSNYIKWCIKDEPYFDVLGACVALKDALLVVRSDSKGTTATRKINSYYVHSWDSISITVQVSASSTKEVGLTITPSSTSKSWQLYSYVTFNV